MKIADYEYVIVVDHNARRQRHKGSCVFLHVADENFSPTSGCTAMAKDKMQTLLAWIDPAKNPVFVTIPATQREAATALWQLP
jgi:L,D-peptidoglycan transpeptidase YkuD (ErfK/YbiS/YcfS/YnhG family)